MLTGEWGYECRHCTRGVCGDTSTIVKGIRFLFPPDVPVNKSSKKSGSLMDSEAPNPNKSYKSYQPKKPKGLYLDFPEGFRGELLNLAP